MEPGEKPDDVDNLFSAGYEELRRLAAKLKRRRGAPIDDRALVNEAWLRMSRSGAGSASMTHFKATALRVMRHVLIDASRRRLAAKRGGAEEVQILQSDEYAASRTASTNDLLALSYALSELERVESRQAKVVRYKCFEGYSMGEIAGLLEVAETTVHRDWRMAKDWLKARLT